MKKLKQNLGMTMAELLIVVAIIAVLAGVAAISVWNYQRSLGQLERDGLAKEIFVAAQNHLTQAFGEGYYGIVEPEKEDGDSNSYGTWDASNNSYYIVVNGGIAAGSAQQIYDQMLPFGSIDETIRLGGSYLIRYQKDVGQILDVFYCSRTGSPTQFNYELSSNDYIGTGGNGILSLRDTADNNNKSERRNWNSHILGWYGGAGTAGLASKTLKAPTIDVVNAERLYVNVTNPNTTGKVRLLVKGLSSNKEHYLNLTATTTQIILDDITSTNDHFCSKIYDDMRGVTSNNEFISGENITIQAVAYDNDNLSNIAYSNKVTTNSLFEGIANLLDTNGELLSNTSEDNTFDTAYIGNIRHLENLDPLVSRLDHQTTATNLETFLIQAAHQTTNLDWINDDNNYWSGKVIVKPSNGESLTNGYSANYYPINPSYALVYDGKNHSISNITCSATNAGLFGITIVSTTSTPSTPSTPSTETPTPSTETPTTSAETTTQLAGTVTASVKSISNLELIDFNISGTASAGALAGTIENTSCTVTNVLARNTTSATTVNVTAPIAGGLIGSMSGTVQYSAAALNINGASTAGGLIGTASGIIKGCYSGGHTDKGEYYTHTEAGRGSAIYNVTGGIAGGLVGSYVRQSGPLIKNSYSTCSVSGSTSGGFIGSGSAKIISCYATGLVNVTSNNTSYAFIGSGSLSSESEGNYYYSIINVFKQTGGVNNSYMLPMAGYSVSNIAVLKPLDLDAETYDTFVGAMGDWNAARAYDPALVTYYRGKYCLKTVDELGADKPSGYDWKDLYVYTHYGDWPAPEVLVINEANASS